MYRLICIPSDEPSAASRAVGVIRGVRADVPQIDIAQSNRQSRFPSFLHPVYRCWRKMAKTPAGMKAGNVPGNVTGKLIANPSGQIAQLGKPVVDPGNQIGHHLYVHFSIMISSGDDPQDPPPLVDSSDSLAVARCAQKIAPSSGSQGIGSCIPAIRGCRRGFLGGSGRPV